MARGIVIITGATRTDIVSLPMTLPIRLFLMLLVSLLTACATGPQFDGAHFQQSITPEDAVLNIETYRNSDVMWGGLLVSNVALQQGSQLEVLAYPLNAKQMPDTTRSSLGRFVLLVDRFLEPVDYSDGRIVTITGKLIDTRDGVIGAATYEFPIVDAEEMYLWPKNAGATQPRVHFGFGYYSGG